MHLTAALDLCQKFPFEERIATDRKPARWARLAYNLIEVAIEGLRFLKCRSAFIICSQTRQVFDFLVDPDADRHQPRTR